MPKVTYVEYNGTAHTAGVPVGTLVMRGAVDNDIPGIDADCGGDLDGLLVRMPEGQHWYRFGAIDVSDPCSLPVRTAA